MKTILVATLFGVILVSSIILTIFFMMVWAALYYVFYKPLKGYIAYTSAVKKGDREYPGAGSFYITETGNIVSYEREERI